MCSRRSRSARASSGSGGRSSTPPRSPASAACAGRSTFCAQRSTATWRSSGSTPSPRCDLNYCLLLRLLLIELDELDDIPRLDAPDGPRAVGGGLHLVVRPEHELRRLDDAAALLPPGADAIGIFARHAVGERIGKLGGDFLGLVE